MVKLVILTTKKADWPKISQILAQTSTVTVATQNMRDHEWELVLEGEENDLETIKQKIQTQTPETICLGSQTFYRLMFTFDGDEKFLHELANEYAVDITRGHLSENNRHISIEDNQAVLGKIQNRLSANGITSSIF